MVRLEDRIEALGREIQLRPERAMSRIDARFETILQSLSSLQTGLNEQRASLRGLYGPVAGAWTTIIVAVVGSALGATALWGGGCQAGEADRAAAAPPKAR